jgi:TonB family protein
MLEFSRESVGTDRAPPACSMSDAKKNASDQVPATIGRYQISGSLGYGAMGAVYKAFDPLIKRQLAIKTVRLDIPRTSPQYRAFLDRFQHEAQISGSLQHAGIVTLFDFGEEGGDPFFAMEFVDGRTIAEVLAEGTRFKPEKVIGLVSQIAAALDYAHKRGVVHRDIKPANLMLYDQDKVKVTDFGIAKLQNADITHSGALLGTPSYMSPEQAMGEKLDGRSDIFSLGVVAFEMLSGQQPFPGPNVTSILYKLVHTEPVEPPGLELLGLVPQKWREVFQKVLAKKPESRYQTASSFVQDLEYCLGSWFTGLGGEETVTIAPIGSKAGADSAPDEMATLSIPRMPGIPPPPPPPPPPVAPAPPAAPARSASSTVLAREEEQTIVLAPSEAEALVEPPATTLLLDRSSVMESEPLPPTLIASAEFTAITPPQASQTQPPSPAGRATIVPSGVVPPPRTPRAGLPLPLVLGGAAAVAVLLGLGAWALRPKAPAPAPEVAPTSAPPATVEPATAATPTPPKAETTPEPAPQKSAAPPPSPTPRPKPATGLADVLSTPSGASVTVDGRPAGETPLRGLKLQPGKRKLEVALAGHDTWTGALDVVAGESGRVDVKLKPTPAPTPEPVDTARVYPNELGQVDTLARRLSGSSPSYPSGHAPRLRSGQRVSVTLRFVVTEAGEVGEITVVESAGKVVDDVVVAAVKGWKYEPATKRGVKVKTEMNFRQTFLGA